MNGFAIDMDRYVRGVTTVSAPIFEAAGTPSMALSAIGFSGQFTPVSWMRSPIACATWHARSRAH